MSEGKKGVFKMQVEALLKVADELETTNTYLYGVAVELERFNTNLEEFIKYVQEKGIRWLSK